MTRPGAIGPAFIGELAANRDGVLLLRALGEGGVHFVFLDASGRVAGLVEILLLGAVTHHAGMLRRGGLLAVFGIWLAGHVSDLRGADAREPTARGPFGSAMVHSEDHESLSGMPD